MDSADAIRVLLVDDQAVIRQAVGSWLGAEPDMNIVGEAEDGESALQLVTQLQPDIVLMDIDMPRLDGLAATSALQAAAPQSAVVILSLYDDDFLQSRAREAGAAAFVSKHQALDELAAVIRKVARPRADTVPADRAAG
ncbi:MAG: response regulator transcription factor [Anaerolineales bacterium]|nr:response regulator transcription factor [Anaerolineales bacterium]